MSVCGWGGGGPDSVGKASQPEEEAGPGLSADLTISLGLGGQTHLRGWCPPGTQAAGAAMERQRTLQPSHGADNQVGSSALASG